MNPSSGRKNQGAEPSHGSALILVLLMIVLLATIAVSFLSTARIEQIATRNFTRQIAAQTLADMATGEAMAKIAEGFNKTNSNATIVTISQPGRIRSYEFTAGGTPTVTTNELFPSNAAAIGTFNINTDGLITGNAAETINVPWEKVTNTSGQTIGRVTYYVDDEGTKLNLNQATVNRDTLNAAGPRPLDIAVLTNADTSVFSNVIAGTISDPKNIQSWTYFFRPEQAVGAAIIRSNHIPFVATAVPTKTNTLALQTPWSTDRLFINELSVDTNGVNTIYEALSGTNPVTGGQATSQAGLTGKGFNDIFSANFATKYTTNGLKQVAANILQMRSSNTCSFSNSAAYSGPLLGADNLDANGIPKEYLGYAPYPMISEVGFSYLFAAANAHAIWPNIQPTVELYNPYPFDFQFPAGANPRLVVKLKSFSFDITYSVTNGPQITKTIKSGQPVISPFTSASLAGGWNPQLSDNLLYYDQLKEFCPTNAIGPYIPKHSRIQTHLMHMNWGMRMELAVDPTKQITIHQCANAKVEVDYIKLLANSAANTNDVLAGYTNTIRDWVTGGEIGELDANIRPRAFPIDLTNAIGPIFANPPTFPNALSEPAPVPTDTAQRKSFSIKVPANVASIISNWSQPGPTWITNTSEYFGQQGLDTNAAITPNTNLSRPSQNTGSDPSYSDNVANAIYADTNNPADMREPYLVLTNYTCPADLGLVPLWQPYRRLRMQIQPAADINAGLIPDWAMLDVMSFGKSNTVAGLQNFQPVNINSQFHVPQGATPPAARHIGLKSLAQVLDNAPDKLADPMSTNGSTVTIAEPRKFLGTRQTGQNDAATIVSNIVGMTWSAGSAWSNRRTTLGFPTNAYLLPSEIMEIKGVADSVPVPLTGGTTEHFKWNEGRASALLPDVSTKSTLFAVYAVAQTGREQNGSFLPDGEAFTKTLVEVDQDLTQPGYPPRYKVKKLYTQPVVSE